MLYIDKILTVGLQWKQEWQNTWSTIVSILSDSHKDPSVTETFFWTCYFPFKFFFFKCYCILYCQCSMDCTSWHKLLPAWTWRSWSHCGKPSPGKYSHNFVTLACMWCFALSFSNLTFVVLNVIAISFCGHQNHILKTIGKYALQEWCDF